MTNATITARFDRALDVVARYNPLAPLVFLTRYHLGRVAPSRENDDAGLSTVEMIIWTGIGLAVALTVGTGLYIALRDRSKVVQNEITNNSIPNG